MQLEKEFVVQRPRDSVAPLLDDDETFTSLFPETRIVSRTANRRETVTPYRALGQSRDIRFVFETVSEGLRFEKVCDGNVWRSLRGEVRLEKEGKRSTRVVIRMEGQTRAFVPELAIRAPMRQQIEEMARSLRSRMEKA
jgi:carbon monoxide dehydrogenase subunit G